eukprot:32512-Chlamydomonas_euryale.AAC.2
MEPLDSESQSGPRTGSTLNLKPEFWKPLNPRAREKYQEPLLTVVEGDPAPLFFGADLALNPQALDPSTTP